MKEKKLKAIFPIITIILIFFIGILVKNILNNKNKEIMVAKDFIQDLAEKNVIDYYDKGDKINEDYALNKVANQNSHIQFSVLVGSYGVDIDKDYNVLGFSNKNISDLSSNLRVAAYSLEDVEVIDEDKAVDYATKYIKEISTDEFIFKEIKNKDGEESPYYVVLFNKCKDGYPIYKQEITVLIDKSTWKLQGYSNYPLEDKEYIKDIKIDEEQAIKILINNFKDINLIKEDIDTVDLAYVETEENKLVLSYVFSIKNKTTEGNNENYSVIINGDNGQIVTSNLEIMKKN